MTNHYDKEKSLHDLEGWIVFYGQQAQRLENDLAMAEVFQASCETADLLLELQQRRQMNEERIDLHLWSDEQVAAMKAKGIITKEKPQEPTPGKCSICGTELKDGETAECFECSIPF